MVEVRAKRETLLCNEFWQAIVLPESVNQQRLLQVGQELQIDAQAFFLQFIGLFQKVLLKAQVPDFAAQRLNVALELIALSRLWGLICLFYGCGCFTSQKLALPVVQRWPAHAELVGNRLRTFLSSAPMATQIPPPMATSNSPT